MDAARLTPFQRRKRAAILEGAKTAFFRNGFGSATMDDVAAAAGVGKQTIYRHFGSKEALFLGLVEGMCRAGGRTLDVSPDVPVEEALRQFGWMLAQDLTATDSLRLYRAIVAEAERLPQLGTLFYRSGLLLVRDLAAAILRRRFDAATAAIRASSFVSLVLGDAYLELSLGAELPDAETRFDRQIEEAIGAALRPKPPSSGGASGHSR